MEIPADLGSNPSDPILILLGLASDVVAGVEVMCMEEVSTSTSSDP